jgi:thiamine-phosphate pyrophosphorylase
LAEFEQANAADVDYIAYGPVFFTKTKDYFIGTKDVAAVLGMARKPVVFIGGISASNLPELLRLGARNIAVMRGILQAEDCAQAARGLKGMLIKPLHGR